MYVCAVQIINGLDIQVSSRWLHYFLATILEHHRSTPIWWLHTGLCKFVWIISTNIWHFGRHTDLKLGELYSLFIFFLTSSTKWFLLYLFLSVTVKTIYTVYLMSEGWLTLFRMSSFVRLLMEVSSNDHSSNKPLVKHTGPILKQITAIMNSWWTCRSELTVPTAKYESKKRGWTLFLTLASYRYRISLHMNHVAHQAGAYLRFLQHKATWHISTPPWMWCWTSLVGTSI